MRTLSEVGLSLIKKWEGIRLTAYQCSAGVWTIGYGHTSGVKKGDTCTQAQADAWLKSDVGTAEKAVNSYDATYSWNQNEFDALVSFTFNCGSGNLKTLLASGTRSRATIAEKIPAYNKAAGVVVQGLVNRRAEEQTLFLKADTSSSGSGSTSSSGSSSATDKTTIKYVQTWLNSTYATEIKKVVGALLAVDGISGTKTETALTVAFQVELNKQYNAGLTVDGVFGSKTKAACPNVKQGASGNITRIIQAALICNGYSVGSSGVDGDYGSNTAAAVKKYQKAKSLTQDGICGKNTFAKLLA